MRHIAAAREDPVVIAALESLESSDAPDVGVEPFADLASWFTTSVAPRVASVALVPDQNAGLLSHLASHLLSSFSFKRQGLVEGDDVLSVLARAEYYLNEKDLDSATRELNQLRGTAKVLLSDWLSAARKRLEVSQALEVRRVTCFLLTPSAEPLFSTDCAVPSYSCFFISFSALDIHSFIARSKSKWTNTRYMRQICVIQASDKWLRVQEQMPHGCR